MYRKILYLTQLESGAGKTTLLNCLSKRATKGVVTGQILIDGRPLPGSFQRSTGYVEQLDVHEPHSTVREALQFSALLRQPREVPTHEKLAYVDKVLKLLELEEIADAIIGTPGNGLSGEQRKRTTIGVELASKPQLLLFLDEPTSGTLTAPPHVADFQVWIRKAHTISFDYLGNCAMQDRQYCVPSINLPRFCLSILMTCCCSKPAARLFTLDL